MVQRFDEKFFNFKLNTEYMNNNNLPQVLYISLDGIMEPLGHSQVLKYLEKLSNNYEINLISFEKINDLNNTKLLDEATKKCSDKSIKWYRLKYRNGYFGLGQTVNILNLLLVPFYILMKKNIAMVHIRSYVPGIFLPVLSLIFRYKLIFDIRGFWADEKHDRHNWKKKSLKYKFFKKLEKYLINKASYVVTLTESSKELIALNFKKSKSSIKVIPTCVDSNEFKRFEPFNNSQSLTIGYLGSVDTAYDFQKFCSFVSQVNNNYKYQINLKIFTKQSQNEVMKLIDLKSLKGVNFDIRFVERKNLPQELSSFDFLAFCLKENFSISASMPTKIAESLSCGIPIICNSFNADINNLIETNRIGLTHNFNDEFDETSLKKLLSLIEDPQTPERCSNAANEYFSLDRGVKNYEFLYKELT